MHYLGKEPPYAPDHRIVQMWVVDEVTGAEHQGYFLRSEPSSSLTSSTVSQKRDSLFARRRAAAKHSVDPRAKVATLPTNSSVEAGQLLQVVASPVDKIEI